MLKVAILDDTIGDIERLKNLLIQYSNNHFHQITVDVFNRGIIFLDNVKKMYDIVFFDIDMPVINGLEVAKKLREYDDKVAIVFVTNLASLAINGYEVNALDFLVKPVSYNQLEMILDKCIKKKMSFKSKRIMIKIKNGYKAIETDKIMYVEVKKHDLIFNTSEGIFETRGVLKELEKNLENKKFVKCNSCYLVNLDYVNSIVGDDVIIKNEKLQISRSKKKEFIEAFLDNLN